MRQFNDKVEPAHTGNVSQLQGKRKMQMIAMTIFPSLQFVVMPHNFVGYLPNKRFFFDCLVVDYMQSCHFNASRVEEGHLEKFIFTSTSRDVKTKQTNCIQVGSFAFEYT